MKKILLLIALIVPIVFSGCSPKQSNNTPSKNTEYNKSNQEQNISSTKNDLFITELIPAPALKYNKLGDSDKQDVRIFLPPLYYKTQKRYPVVYYLHGFGSSYLEIEWYKSAYTDYMKTKGINEFILVGVNGRNSFGGSFYVNSPVTGNWEDYVVKDVVKYIDNKFRTIPISDARGISGFSMGGFGALYIGFRHPDVFSSIFALSPGIFDKKDIQKVIKTWNSKIILGYGAAFAPNLNKPYPHIDMPKFNNSKQDNQILLKWENGAGNFDYKVVKYLDNIKKLKGIQIQYGTKDFFDWIPGGCKKLSNSLTAKNINNQLVSFDGSHGDKNHIIVRKSMFPYFSKLLKTKK